MATLNFLGGRLLFGTEYVGYTINIYEPGTTTPKTTYKDSALTVGNENTATITLDANGAAQVWYSGNAKWVFKDTSGSTIYTDDNVNLSASTSATGTGNLALNPSFESDTDADGLPDNWTRTLYSGGAFTLDTTDSYGGAQSAKFTSTGTGGGYLTSESTFPVSPSVAYTIGWAMKGTADVRNTVDILWYKKDGSASGVSASTNVYDDSATNPTSWAEKWYQATSPSDAAFAAIRLTGCHSSDATSGTTRFDQVFFTDFVHSRGLVSSLTFTSATPLVFEGTTADAFETSITVTDPTADRTQTIHNSTGTFLLHNATHGSEEFTAGGNHTVAAGVGVLWITATAAGGGGGDSNTGSGVGGCGGGSGEWCFRKQILVTPGEVIAVTLGANGAASAGSGSGDGGTAADTTFGSYITLDGGHGGGANGGTPGAGGTGNGHLKGKAGGDASGSAGGAGGAPGAFIPSLSNTGAGAVAGYTGIFGVGGSAPAATAVGGGGVGYGAGGSGGSGGNSAGGAGAAAYLIVEW